MKVKIIIEDVDVTVAQLLGLLGEIAAVETEQPQIEQVVEKTVAQIKQVVEKTAKVVQPKKTETSKKVKKSKKLTCKYCEKNFTYKKSYKKCRTRCKAKSELKLKPAIKATKSKKEVESAKDKSKPKFTRRPPKMHKPKKSKPKYERLSDSDLKEMVASIILGNINQIVTSGQITAMYVRSVKSKYEMTTAAKQELSKIESRVVGVMKKAAKIIGVNYCMSMALAPNGWQVAVFDKVGMTVAKLKRRL
tara:strand:- start:105 stop:848 length:744 start_codon:yes stop_codon:yes gene_type:complete